MDLNFFTWPDPPNPPKKPKKHKKHKKIVEGTRKYPIYIFNDDEPPNLNVPPPIPDELPPVSFDAPEPPISFDTPAPPRKTLSLPSKWVPPVEISLDELQRAYPMQEKPIEEEAIIPNSQSGSAPLSGEIDAVFVDPDPFAGVEEYKMFLFKMGEKYIEVKFPQYFFDPKTAKILNEWSSYHAFQQTPFKEAMKQLRTIFKNF